MVAGPGTPTPDQLQVLVRVADAGNFTAAARAMNRAVSVVSYTISTLEAQLGTALFDRTASRTPRLTEAGRAVLAEARLIVDGVDTLRAKVAGMQQGLEGELHLAVDSLLSRTRLVDALTAFAEYYPTVRLHLHVETLGAVAHLVLERTAGLGISGPFTSEMATLVRTGVGTLRMVPVTGPGHPLAAAGHPPGAARRHVQLVIYDRSPRTAGRDFSVTASRTWRIGGLSAKHMLLRAGIGGA